MIRTPDQRLRVFVSSTLGELADERRAVLRAVSALRLSPVLFELGARPHHPQDLYRAYLAQSDIFIGMYWQRYGQIGPGMQVSGIEEEFDLSSALPRLLYVKVPAPERDPRLAALLGRMKHQVSYRNFGAPAELGRLVRDDLATLLSERFAAGRSAAAERPSMPEVSARVAGPRPLPVGTTSLVGREQAIEEVTGVIGRSGARLVTLTGPGGVGKTRLAVAVGERLRDRFAEGTAFVPLAGVTEPERVLPGIARAVGAELAGTGSPLDALADRLGDGAWLLILDNLEQVVDVARDLDELMARCRGVAILATSLRVLRLRAEREYPVPPLTVPGDPATVPLDELATSPAVALFVERSRAVRHDFALTDRNAAAVAALCRRLEGLPLAIELAAARIRLLDPDALLARVSTSLDALGKGTVDMPERHRTLRATVEWSVGLLDDGERSLLETVAVFVDGWTIDAAADVAGLGEDEALDLTEALARHSLVHVERTDLGPRSRMLETIREFVCERMQGRADFGDVKRRHADYYRRLIEGADRPLRGAGHSEWDERLQVEARNLSSAVAWYLTHDPTPLPHLFRVLWPFWDLSDRMVQARPWVERLLPAADSLDAPPRAELMWAALVTANEVGDDAATLAARQGLGSLLAGIEDPCFHAVALLAMAWTAPILGDFDGALRAASDSLDELRGQDEPYWTAVALMTTGFMESTAGRHDDALALVGEARDLTDQFDYVWLAAICRVWLATLELARNRSDEARRLLDQALDLSLATHTVRTMSLCLVGYAQLALSDGDAQLAARLVGAAEGLRSRVGLRVWPPLRRGEAELTAEIRDTLGADRFEQAFASGVRLNHREAVAAVRDRPGVGTPAS